MRIARFVDVAWVVASLVFAVAPLARADADAGPTAPEKKPGLSLHITSDDDSGDKKSGSDAIASLPPDVRDRLTGDEIENIMRRSADSRVESAASTIVPSVFFFTIIAIVVAVLFGRHRREKVLHETLRVMIERGAEIPKELLGVEKKTNDRRRGIILISIGVGLSGFLAAVDHSGAWAFGLVPLLIGVGYLVAWALDRDRQA